VTAGRRARITAIFVQPLALAGIVALREDSRRIEIAASVLVAVWVVCAGALLLRAFEARRGRESFAARLDVLTATGATTLLLADAALFASTIEAWASLSVIGVLGLGGVLASVIWLELVAGGDEPWRRATIERSIVPASATEGDPLREQLRLCDVRIPAGTRLFASGRATSRSPITRYAVGTEASMGDVTLVTELGPAPRGEHRTPPLALWIGDVLGLARTPIVYRGETELVVYPKPAIVDGTQDIVGTGGDDRAKPATMLPTEGTFRTREYVPGDDTRRIHWVRSVNAGKLVVRLPDEIPANAPTVRVVLDTEIAHVGALASTAPDEVLDGMVRVWLGIGKALVEAGHRVILVAATPTGIVERQLGARSREGVKLGARVRWDGRTQLTRMLDDKAPAQIVVSARPRHLGVSCALTWVVVPDVLWAQAAPRPPAWAPLVLPHPIGSAENRGGRRKQAYAKADEVVRDRAYFSQIACNADWSVTAGGFVARPTDGRVQLAVIR